MGPSIGIFAFFNYFLYSIHSNGPKWVRNGSEMGPEWVRNSIEQVRHLLDLNNWNVGYVPVDYNWLEVFQMWVRYLVGNV